MWLNLDTRPSIVVSARCFREAFHQSVCPSQQLYVPMLESGSSFRLAGAATAISCGLFYWPLSCSHFWVGNAAHRPSTISENRGQGLWKGGKIWVSWKLFWNCRPLENNIIIKHAQSINRPVYIGCSCLRQLPCIRTLVFHIKPVTILIITCKGFGNYKNGNISFCWIGSRHELQTRCSLQMCHRENNRGDVRLLWKLPDEEYIFQNNQNRTSEHSNLPVLHEEVERMVSNLEGWKSPASTKQLGKKEQEQKNEVDEAQQQQMP